MIGSQTYDLHAKKRNLYNIDPSSNCLNKYVIRYTDIYILSRIVESSSEM